MFSVLENTCQGASPWTPPETNREAKSWGGRRADPGRSSPVFTLKGFDFFPPCPRDRGVKRHEEEENMTPFHAISASEIRAFLQG